MRASLAKFDIVRLDHFRGFEAYWEVPGAEAGDQRAMGKGSRRRPVSRDDAALGPLPIVAENLGLITPEVEALREQLGYPGMSVLQFAFGAEGSVKNFDRIASPQIMWCTPAPTTTTPRSAGGTRKADATQTAEDIAERRAVRLRYLGVDGREIHWTLIRAAFASVSNTALIPMQASSAWVTKGA